MARPRKKRLSLQRAFSQDESGPPLSTGAAAAAGPSDAEAESEDAHTAYVESLLNVEVPDLAALRDVAAKQGLANDGLRARAWPLLLGLVPSAHSSHVHSFPSSSRSNNASGLGASSSSSTPRLGAEAATDRNAGSKLSSSKQRQGGVHVADGTVAPAVYRAWSEATHRDSNVVMVDVARSLHAFTRGMSDTQRGQKRAALQRLLNATVNAHNTSDLGDRVFYYQGLHDIASVLLLVLGERAAFPLMRHLVCTHLRDATREGLDAVMEVLWLMYPLLHAADPQLCEWLRKAALQPYFALAWLITWWAHDVHELADAARLFDLFIAGHPMMPLYVGAAALRASRSCLLSLDEMPELHSAIVNLRPTADGQLSWDDLAGQALDLFHQAPPQLLVASRCRPILVAVTPAAVLAPLPPPHAAAPSLPATTTAAPPIDDVTSSTGYVLCGPSVGGIAGSASQEMGVGNKVSSRTGTHKKGSGGGRGNGHSPPPGSPTHTLTSPDAADNGSRSSTTCSFPSGSVAASKDNNSSRSTLPVWQLPHRPPVEWRAPAANAFIYEKDEEGDPFGYSSRAGSSKQGLRRRNGTAQQQQHHPGGGVGSRRGRRSLALSAISIGGVFGVCVLATWVSYMRGGGGYGPRWGAGYM